MYGFVGALNKVQNLKGEGVKDWVHLFHKVEEGPVEVALPLFLVVKGGESVKENVQIVRVVNAYVSREVVLKS